MPRGLRVNRLAVRLACMSIATERLSVLSYTHTMSDGGHAIVMVPSS